MSAESPVSDDAATPPPPEVPSGPDPAASKAASPIGHTRISRTWVGIIIGVVILVILLVFIIQNSRSVNVSFFTVSGDLPLGVALLLAAVAGVVIAAIVGSLRIWQLRHRIHRSKSSSSPSPE